MNKNAPEVIQLRKDVEARFGTRPATPADFLYLLVTNVIFDVLDYRKTSNY